MQFSKEEYARKRIHNGSSVQIENSVTRATVRHHEASLVMPNSYPRDGIFNQHLTTTKDSYIFFIRCCQYHRKTYRESITISNLAAKNLPRDYGVRWPPWVTKQMKKQWSETDAIEFHILPKTRNGRGTQTSSPVSNEPRHEKTYLRGLRSDKTQTS